MQDLTDLQRKAVEWTDGPLLVLAGPGSGKTRVLTCRVARLLEASPNQRFRILALTFTNKAAHEMKTRIATLVPGSEERAEINTFHGFCVQLLRQHGVHLEIKPNFEYTRAPLIGRPCSKRLCCASPIASGAMMSGSCPASTR